MSSRRNGSVSRAAETASKTRLHMDRNPQHSRMTDPSNPAGRRKELDNVMKRARQASPGSWDRKLLEVEEKDPNRWRHSGYKQMYLEGSGSVSPRRSRSPLSGRRSRSPLPLGRRSRSPIPRRVRSPVARRSPRKSRSPRRSPRRSPVRRAPSPVRRRSPRTRSPIPRTRSPVPRPRSPVRARSPVARARSPVARARSPVARARSPVARARSPVARRATPPPRSRAMAVRPRPPSPPPRKSSSGSSGSSCSDESCSVCSAKNKKGPPPPPPKGAKIPPRLKSSSPNRARAIAGVSGSSGARAVQPTRELLKAREGSKRTREEKVLEWQRGQLLGGAARSGPVPIPPEQIKREGERAPPPTDPRPRPHPPPHPRVSPAAINAALTRRSESDSDTASSEQKPHRLTLSERFGKMAQWSMDRSARLENMNMRITRRDAQLHVRIDAMPEADVKRHPALMEIEGPGAGSYPEELLSAAPGGLPSWDDVTVRYDYYKKKGYLRGLTLGDYVKWEEWWYKYQEWLERERAYERWAEGESRPNRRDGRRRKGGGRHRRS